MLFTFSCKIAHPEHAEATLQAREDGEGWNADFRSKDGRVDIVLSYVRRHPYVVSEGLQFRRSLIEVIEAVPRLLEYLGGDAASMHVAGSSELLAYYFEGTNFVDNEAAITELRGLIQKSIDEVNKALGRQYKGLAADFSSLPETLRWRLLIAAPFLYDATNGEPRSVEHLLTTIARQELAGAYKDAMQQHYRQLLPGDFQSAWNKYAGSAFLGSKAFQDAVTPVTEGGAKLSPQVTSIERLPAAFSAFRCFGDCSILSVPYHGFAKEARVYLIRNSDRADDRPAGHAMVAEAKAEGVDGARPYTITINGKVNHDQIGAVLKLIAFDFGVTEEFVPNFETSGAVVNTDEMKLGMQLDRQQGITLRLPPGWKKASAFTTKYNKTGYENYYGNQGLETANLGKVDVDPTKIKRLTVANPYPSVKELASLRPWQRALLAYQLNDSTFWPRLHVTEAEVAAAEPLARFSPIYPENFQRLKKNLGFTEDDILLLDPVLGVLTYLELKDTPQQLSDKTSAKILNSWKWVEADLNNRLPAYSAPLKRAVSKLLNPTKFGPDDRRLYIILGTVKGLKAAGPSIDELMDINLAHDWNQVEIQRYLHAEAKDKSVFSGHKEFFLRNAIGENRRELALAYVNFDMGGPREDAFNLAAAAGFSEIVTALIRGGVDPGANRNEAYITAIREGHGHVIEILIKAGIDINTSFYGIPPLAYAVQKGKVDIVKQLLGVGIDQKNKNEALELLVKENPARALEMAQLLMEAGASVENIKIQTVKDPRIREYLNKFRERRYAGSFIDLCARFKEATLNIFQSEKK